MAHVRSDKHMWQLFLRPYSSVDIHLWFIHGLKQMCPRCVLKWFTLKNICCCLVGYQICCFIWCIFSLADQSEHIEMIMICQIPWQFDIWASHPERDVYHVTMVCNGFVCVSKANNQWSTLSNSIYSVLSIWDFQIRNSGVTPKSSTLSCQMYFYGIFLICPQWQWICQW